MRTLDQKSRRSVTRIAGVVLVVSCIAGVTGLIKWSPPSSASLGDVIAPADLPSGLAQRSDAEMALPETRPSGARCPDCGVIESTREIRQASEAGRADQCTERGRSAAVTTHRSQSADNADLAILLDWHMDARNGHSSMHHRIGCAQQAAMAAQRLVEAGKAYEILVRFRDGSSQVLTEAGLSTWRRGDRVTIVTETAD